MKRARFKKNPGGLGGWVFRSLLKPGLEATVKNWLSNRAGEGRDWGGNVISFPGIRIKFYRLSIPGVVCVLDGPPLI